MVVRVYFDGGGCGGVGGHGSGGGGDGRGVWGGFKAREEEHKN